MICSEIVYVELPLCGLCLCVFSSGMMEAGAAVWGVAGYLWAGRAVAARPKGAGRDVVVLE